MLHCCGYFLDFILGGQYESKGMLTGSNAGVMSVDFDSTGTLILGASSDFASRVWTVADQRLRVSLYCLYYILSCLHFFLFIVSRFVF
jgi:autophagy-related protein 16